MIAPEAARSQAISWLTEQGLDRGFVENASLKVEDAKTIVRVAREQNPKKILEIGTFVGVSTAVLGLCLPEVPIVCIDADLPAIAQNILCLKKFEISDRRTNLEFVAGVVEHFGIAEQFTLNRGFFSCCFPEGEDRRKLAEAGIEVSSSDIIGRQIVKEEGPFEVAFLDADHHQAAVKSDLTLLYPYMVPGGTIILHDAGLDYWGQQVRSAVQEFLAEHPEVAFRVEGDVGIISVAPKGV
ncbi:MAG: class I SAM-dependent methyltransferase [Oscillatoria sp. SIO1A7]|nr:class I SAM-dependent methyltransferase [Oscillatoria sp. SIO1A7]